MIFVRTVHARQQNCPKNTLDSSLFLPEIFEQPRQLFLITGKTIVGMPIWIVAWSCLPEVSRKIRERRWH